MLTSSSATGKLTFAVFPTGLSARTPGLNTTVSRITKILDSNANFKEFDVRNAEKDLRVEAQTLHLYNPRSHQWSIYYCRPVQWKPRRVFRLNISPNSARWEQSFSPDGGKTWEVNWICELSH